MKKYLAFSTLAILFFLFGCEEEHALRLHTAPEYYQGRAMLPTGHQIEMTEEDRFSVLEACTPNDALSKIPDGDRNWLGTVTLTQPLTMTPSTPAFPTATFFNVGDHSYVRCHVETITYVKKINSAPKSIIDAKSAVQRYPENALLHISQSHERSQFIKHLQKNYRSEHIPVEQTLVHVTLPFSGQLELSFTSSDHNETMVIPVDLPTRPPSLSLGLGIEQSEKGMNYAIYKSSNKKHYDVALRPTDSSVSRLLDAEMLLKSSTKLIPDTHHPLFRFSFIRDGKPHQQNVSIVYKENELLHGDELKKEMNRQFTNQRHVVFHELALIGTESIDESFLRHATDEEEAFLFKAIERSNATSHAGTPASVPHLTLFEGVRAQTFDISYDKRNVFLTTHTGSHFKLLREDADRWHKLFEEK